MPRLCIPTLLRTFAPHTGILQMRAAGKTSPSKPLFVSKQPRTVPLHEPRKNQHSPGRTALEAAQVCVYLCVGGCVGVSVSMHRNSTHRTRTYINSLTHTHTHTHVHTHTHTHMHTHIHTHTHTRACRLYLLGLQHCKHWQPLHSLCSPSCSCTDNDLIFSLAENAQKTRRKSVEDAQKPCKLFMHR